MPSFNMLLHGRLHGPRRDSSPPRLSIPSMHRNSQSRRERDTRSDTRSIRARRSTLDFDQQSIRSVRSKHADERRPSGNASGSFPRLLFGRHCHKNGGTSNKASSTSPVSTISESSIQTQLMDAIAYDRVAELADILTSPHKSVYVDFRKSRYPPPGTIGCGRKHTLLSFASMRASNPEIVKLLLKSSSSVGIHPEEQANPDGLTPAYLACCWGHLEAIRLLRSAGSEIDPKLDRHKDKNNKSCVASSVASSVVSSNSTSTSSSDDESTVNGSNSNQGNQPHAENLFTPLMAAANFGHVHVVKQLLEWGVRVSFSTTVSSALALAINQGNQAVVDALVVSTRIDWKLEIKAALSHRANEFARRFYVLSKRHRYCSSSPSDLPPRTPISASISTIRDKDIQQEITHLASLGFLTECPVCFDHVGTRESDEHEIIGKNSLGSSNVIGNIVIHSCGRLFCEDCLAKMTGTSSYTNGAATCPICRKSMNLYGKNSTCLRLSASHRPTLKGYLM